MIRPLGTTRENHGITQSFNSVKLNASYGLTIDHGVKRVWAGTMVNHKAKFIVRRFRHYMNGNNINSGEECVERFREAISLHFFLSL